MVNLQEIGRPLEGTHLVKYMIGRPGTEQLRQQPRQLKATGADRGRRRLIGWNRLFVCNGLIGCGGGFRVVEDFLFDHGTGFLDDIAGVQ